MKINRKINQVISEISEKRNVRRLIDKLSFITKGKPFRGLEERNKYTTLTELIDNHFGFFTEKEHPNRKTMNIAINLLNSKSAIILETGSSAWGTNSTMLFDSYVNSFGGSFESVDIRLQPSICLRSKCSKQTLLHCDDSVSFLKKWSSKNKKVDLVYLDSWDVNWNDSIPSAMHGLSEFFAIFPSLRKGSVLLVDDTPLNLDVMNKVQPKHIESFLQFEKKFGFPPGKGSLIKKHLESIGLGRQIAHDYQLVWQL